MTRIVAYSECMSYNGYTFTHPKPDSQYVKVLKYVFHHSPCSRDEISRNALGLPLWRSSRGWCSSMYAAMVKKGLIIPIYAGRRCTYEISQAGCRLLEEVYAHETKPLRKCRRQDCK